MGRKCLANRLRRVMPTTMAPPAPCFSSPGVRGGRDRQLIDFVGRHGVVAIEHVMAALGVGQASAYQGLGRAPVV
ncbi:MAG TPA: hypothetical protein VNY83_02830 [Solirubrobacterales bacterium]|nr:hypothetical protein [Solirubrobacterales bacterium]